MKTIKVRCPKIVKISKNDIEGIKALYKLQKEYSRNKNEKKERQNKNGK